MVKFFVTFILCEGSFFNICVLSQSRVYLRHFQNIHILTYQKKLLHTHFFLFLKSQVKNLQRCLLLFARCSLLFARCSLIFARCSLLFALIARHFLLVACYFLLDGRYMLFVARYVLLVACYYLLVACYFLLVAG